ncbi:hypothetical protein [Pseudomonas sp. DC3000-4b1]|uniref:hypothetical protein n=1 Tax=unclassified Pseudomonas TaxID=196821 RepID=UPI003CF74023
MNELRLGWEPTNGTPIEEIERKLREFTDNRGGVLILGNATLIAIPQRPDAIELAKKVMNEARFIVDFQVIPLKDGDYMVAFHNVISVFVGKDEFSTKKAEIESRIEDLKFPGEILISPPNENSKHTIIGLYARGKLQKDAYEFTAYKHL